MNHEKKIMKSKNLQELCQNLRSFEEFRKNEEYEDRNVADIDISSLPTFGGEAVDIDGVYSWDQDCFLVLDDTDNWEIVERRDHWSSKD